MIFEFFPQTLKLCEKSLLTKVIDIFITYIFTYLYIITYIFAIWIFSKGLVVLNP